MSPPRIWSLRGMQLMFTVGVMAVVLANFAGSGSGLARAGVALWHYDVEQVSKFPIAGSHYESVGTVSYPGLEQAGIAPRLLDLHQRAPVNINTAPLPAPGSSVDVSSTFDEIVEMSFFGPGSLPFEGFFDITYRVGGGGGGGGSGGVLEGTWPIELLSMNLTGNVPGIGEVMIRESPTLPSTGQHTLSTSPPMGGMPGMLKIDSFFDVFTELSLDRGFTWHQTDGPFRMTITHVTPEPGTAALAMGAIAGPGLWAGRRRR